MYVCRKWGKRPPGQPFRRWSPPKKSERWDFKSAPESFRLCYAIIDVTTKYHHRLIILLIPEGPTPTWPSQRLPPGSHVVLRQERSLVAHARVLDQAVALRTFLGGPSVTSGIWHFPSRSAFSYGRVETTLVCVLFISSDGVMALNSFLELPVWTQPRTEGRKKGRKEDRK